MMYVKCKFCNEEVLIEETNSFEGNIICCCCGKKFGCIVKKQILTCSPFVDDKVINSSPF